VSVDKPPKISEVPARPVPIEVLPPLPAPAAHSVPPADGPPIHGLSALILVAVDSLWLVFDLPAFWPAMPLAILACFVAVFIPTYLIQRHLKNDSKDRALTFATILGVLAAIPTPITGTPVGFALLAWTGLGKLLGRSPSK
jgi:integral membrane sensor domain MASE1